MGIFFQTLTQTASRPFSFCIYFFPIIAVLVFSFLLDKQQEDLIIPISIVDEDKSELSKSFIQQMKKESRVFVLEDSRELAKKRLMKNEVDSVFLIKENFDKQLLNEERDETIELWSSSTSIATGVVKELLASKVTRLTTTIKASDRVVKIFERKFGRSEETQKLWEEAYQYTDQQWEPRPLMTIAVSTGKTTTKGTKKKEKHESTVPYVNLWGFFTMLSCFLSMEWFIKNQPLFAKIRSTYKGLAIYLWQRTAAIFFLHIIQAILMFAVFIYFGMIEKNNLLIVHMIFFILFCISSSLFIASINKNRGNYLFFGFFIVFMIGIIGDSFFSISDVSPKLKLFSSWMPQSLLNESLFPNGFILMTVGLLLAVWAVGRLQKR
ncbi:ABC-2 type transport system permease protein [Oikeobacillus pervagus]|uniref:ABC-2 type transport system permease protein n=1 Tax=Oikeobacillus pervagus TaxID=1325931 RepID=A0AAJ1WKD4_9BACI|nr:ABC transporter permease [Oikeobacillus pervagus]MDQ0216630.1 ABC-2 type transport system permease protein [Oikeobacillus pervagus]